MDLTPYKNCKAHKQWFFITNEDKPYRPCCYFKTDLDATDVNDYQTQLSKVDIAKNCAYCIELEQQGNKYSQRQEVEDTLADDVIRITVSFDNLCNLKCTYCSPIYSTQIAKEYLGEGHSLYKSIYAQAPKKIKFIKSIIESTNKHIEINILGGEPLINPAIYEFLEWLSQQTDSKKISVSILTNGTVFNNSLYEYSRQFKHLSLGFSIDGVGDIFELIRFNAKWSEVKKNIDQYYALQDDKFFISFQYALTWMNVMGFADWYNWVYQSYPNTSCIHLNKLKYPEAQSVDIIPPLGKKLVAKTILTKLVNVPINDNKFIEVQEKFKTQLLTGDDHSYLYDDAKTVFDNFDFKRSTNYKIILSDILQIIEDTKNHSILSENRITTLNL
jgi:organic radical activating enzyme